MKLSKKRLSRFKRDSFSIAAIVLVLLGSVAPVLAHVDDDPSVTMVLIDQLEVSNADESDPWVLHGQAWVGQDLKKLWFKAELENADSEIEHAEVQALYSQAISPFWDFQIGLRQDYQPDSNRSWGVVGLQGLAPYFLEIDSALFVGESGDIALRLDVEYELLFTQRLILTPEIEVNFYGQGDSEFGNGSGLSNIESGLRLRYEIRREFAPYIGINWSKSYGNTAALLRKEGKDVEDLQWVIGVRAWF